LTYFDFLQLDFNNKFVSIAIADSSVRELISQRLKENNVSILDIKSENVMIYDKVSIGPGSILCAFTTLTSNIKIGKFFHANLYSYVAHDCLIGDFVTFAPGVKCNGNVVIEDYAYIGTGAIIKQGSAIKRLTIGEGAVVGMGAVVTKSVKAGDIVFGNPAKSIKRQKR
jgi:sugar O-acyltransferase (sialic acid O-acetyltransferase NeuD family)